MIFKIVWIILMAALGLLFAGLNARNTADISLALHTFRDVPVYTGVLIAFFLGILYSIPLFKRRKKREKRGKVGEPMDLQDHLPPDVEAGE